MAIVRQYWSEDYSNYGYIASILDRSLFELWLYCVHIGQKAIGAMATLDAT